MRNYAEELAYWYFRFNGFFLLNNYVSHPDDRDVIRDAKGKVIRSHSDSDLLAIRIGQPMEEVGINFSSDKVGIRQCDELNNLIKHVCVKEKNPTLSLIGIICEVKAGARTAFNDDNLKAQLKRFGFVQNPDQARTEIKEKGHSFIEKDKLVIRILVSVNGTRQAGFKPIKIQTPLAYIASRFEQLGDKKHGGWDKFDSTLMQFLLRHGNLFQIKKKKQTEKS